MKAYKIFYLVIAFAMLFACVKKDNELKLFGEENSSSNAGSSDTATASQEMGCAPYYGDSVLCYQLLSSGQDYKVSPLNNPGKGKYIAMPEGLIIDNNTGEINVTKSESGLAYKVGFIAEGSSDTCFTRVITSGINYLDGIYVLGDDDTLAVPVYKGTLDGSPVCGAGGLFGNCEFDDDEDDDNGNGIFDEPPPGLTFNSKNIRIDKQTGVISLKRSLLDGIFGTLTPANGKTVNATLYYRLDDCSNKALRKIDISFTYYSKLSDVPKALIDDITNTVNSILGLLFRSAGERVTNPRPPHIVVVANR
jgi:hypothetical protein